MKNPKWHGVMFKLAFLGAVVGASLGMANDADADADADAAATPLPLPSPSPSPLPSLSPLSSSCAGLHFLCFYDYHSNQYGNVSGNNPDWRAFGWNNRADVFKNDGATHNACVYSDFNYHGQAWFIPRNGRWYNVPDNTVSSNWWTQGGLGSCF